LTAARSNLDYRRYGKPDPELYRPAEVNLLRGDASKARRVLGWTHHIRFEDLVKEMVDEDCRVVGIQRAKK
jgi:GDPmannose 4,6-dehydratase